MAPLSYYWIISFMKLLLQNPDESEMDGRRILWVTCHPASCLARVKEEKKPKGFFDIPDHIADKVREVEVRVEIRIRGVYPRGLLPPGEREGSLMYPLR